VAAAEANTEARRCREREARSNGEPVSNIDFSKSACSWNPTQWSILTSRSAEQEADSWRASKQIVVREMSSKPVLTFGRSIHARVCSLPKSRGFDSSTAYPELACSSIRKAATWWGRYKWRLLLKRRTKTRKRFNDK
jgi:hypothetical protein